jgi:capsular exopolysaccharide synthesis family protein
MTLDREITLGNVLAIVHRWGWFIAGAVLVCGGAAAVWSQLQSPVYKSVATVVVEREEPASLERVGSYFLIPEYYQTHFELLKSPGIIEQAARRLNLPERAEYRPKRPSAFDNWIQGVVPSFIQEAVQDSCKVNVERQDLGPEDGQEPKLDGCLLKAFEQQIEVKPVRGTRLAHISVESQDPELGAQAANTLAMAYIDGRLAMNAKGRERSAEWYSTQLDRLRKKVEEAEYQLYAYRIKHGLVDSHDGQRDVAQKFGELNSELVRAEMKAAEAQSRYQHISSMMRPDGRDVPIDLSLIDSSSEVLSSSLIQALRAQEIKASGQIAELMDKYGPLHPKLAHAKSELADLRQRIQGEVEKVYGSLKHEHDVAQARVRVIKDAVNRQKQEKSKLEQNEIEYGILDREAKSTKQLYEMFLKQMKDRELSPEVSDTPVYLADAAVAPARPVKPRKKLNIVFGMMVGLMSSVALAVFFEAKDSRLKSTEDVERHLPMLPVLSVIPRMAKHDAGHVRIVETNGGREAAESFRALRTTLLLAAADDQPRCILVTSAGEGEGKTTVAANLATAFAQLQQVQVVLINADLRKPESHPLFAVTAANGHAPGLCQYLGGHAQIDQIIYPSVIPNLLIVPQGRIPSNPSELIHSQAMTNLLKRCQAQGWHVIVDSSPVLPVAEALVLATMVEGVLLIVSARETSREAGLSAFQRLTNNGAKILGLVIQKAPPRKLPYSFYADGKNHRQLTHQSVPAIKS